MAYVAQAHHAAVVSLGTIGLRPGAIDHLIRKRQAKSQQLLLVSEGGSCGSWLSRSRPHQGPVGWIVAPVWLPTKPRERVTTNRREAVTLARLRRAGALTPVDVPTVDEAAMRDLCRARDEALRARQTAQLRPPALRLRHALRSTGRAS